MQIKTGAVSTRHFPLSFELQVFPLFPQSFIVFLRPPHLKSITMLPFSSSIPRTPQRRRRRRRISLAQGTLTSPSNVQSFVKSTV